MDLEWEALKGLKLSLSHNLPQTTGFVPLDRSGFQPPGEMSPLISSMATASGDLVPVGRILTENKQVIALGRQTCYCRH